MAVTTISRTTWTDDSGGGTDGTIINNAALQAIYDKIDLLLSTGTAGTVTFTTHMVWEGAKKLFINDTVNTALTTGLTINQGAADDEIIALKSSDVAHGVTTLAETDTYAQFMKASDFGGGLKIRGYNEIQYGIHIQGIGGNVDVTKSTVALGPIILDGLLASGTGTVALGANSNILIVRDVGTARFILDADGDSHQDVGTAWTNFDDGDDIARLNAVAVSLAREGDPLRDEFVQHFEQHRSVIGAMPGKALVTFNDDGHHFVNMSRLTMLLTGAVRQLANQQSQLLAQVADLQRRLPA